MSRRRRRKRKTASGNKGREMSIQRPHCLVLDTPQRARLSGVLHSSTAEGEGFGSVRKPLQRTQRAQIPVPPQFALYCMEDKQESERSGAGGSGK